MMVEKDASFLRKPQGYHQLTSGELFHISPARSTHVSVDVPTYIDLLTTMPGRMSQAEDVLKRVHL